MTWIIGDGFDFYSTNSRNDARSGSAPLWDSVSNTSFGLAGRFAGSLAVSGDNLFTKTTGSNDSTVFGNFAFIYNAVLGGTGLLYQLQLLDDSTAQCTVYLRGDGSLVFYNGDSTGTLLATYAGAFPASTWEHFQIKLIISSTVGEIHVRKNGNTADDFSATGLNTMKSSNAYTNKIIMGPRSTTSAVLDDFYYFNSTGAAPNNWQGDVRSVPLMVASDPGSPKFSKFPNSGTLFSKINEAVEDGDTTYIFDNVVNDEDDFGITALTSNPLTIIAAQVKAFVKKSSSGARSGDIILKSSSASANVGSTNLSSTYGYLSLPLTTDPNTSAAWTQTNLNAITIGPKVTV